MMKDFKTLTVYKKSIQLEDLVDEIVRSFPSEEKYRMVDQLIRCTTSIGANIAESNGGQYAGRERYHLGVAFGSANEVRYWVERAYRKGFIDRESFEKLDNIVQEIRRMLVGMFKRLDSVKSAS